MSKARITELVAVLTAARDAYYNSDTLHVHEGVKITDARYDRMEDELRELDPGNSFFKKVGHKVGKKQEVKLPIQMPSLNKIRTEAEIAAFAKANKGPYVVMPKWDGVSFEAETGGGIPAKLYTRGDGEYGCDISFMLRTLKIPEPTVRVIVRGEIIMPQSVFKAKWSREHSKTDGDKYENARNLTSGVTNKRGFHKALKDHDLIVYSVLSHRDKPSRMLQSVEKRGFRVTEYVVMDNISLKALTTQLTRWRETLGYDLDGLVIQQDEASPAPISNPIDAVAFKVNTSVETEVTGIEWKLSKHRKWKCTVLLKPVRLSGATVQRASGKNAKHLKDMGIGPGAIVEITRSGEVIPDILTVLKRAPMQYPPGEWKWGKSGVDIELVGKETNAAVEVKRITEFFVVLGMENMKEATVERLMDAGYDTVGKIIRAKPSDFLKIEGFKAKTAERLFTGIQAAIDEPELHHLMHASGCFGENLGTRKLVLALQKEPKLLQRFKTSPYALADSLVEVKGYSDKTVSKIMKGLPKFIKWLDKHPEVNYIVPKPRKVKANAKFSGKTFVFTGFRDADAEKRIQDEGGKIGSGVNKDTTYLVTKDPNGTSSKLVKARSLGVTIINGSRLNQLLME